MGTFSIGNDFGRARTSAWADLQSARERRAAAYDDFSSRSAAAVSVLTTISTNQVEAGTNLAAMAALSRIQKASKAKQAKAAATSTPTVNVKKSSQTLSDGTTVQFSNKVTFASGTTLDPDHHTMTLSDGTMIDTNTGLKIVNITA
jgi:hypothetical protein